MTHVQRAVSRIIYGLLLVIYVATWHVAYATPQDFQGWFQVTNTVTLDDEKRYQLNLELQPRIGDDWERMGLLLVRPSISYNITKALSVHGGYAWVPQFFDVNYHRTFRQEHRIWQGVSYRHDLFGVLWQHRLRQEQRIIERSDGVSNRTRYQLRGSRALNPSGTFGVTLFDEIFVTLNSTENGPWSGYDRNRVFAGPYWKDGPIKYEVGYLGEHVKRFGPNERWNHVLAMSATFDF